MSNDIKCIPASCRSQIQTLSDNIKSALDDKSNKKKTWTFVIPKDEKLSFFKYNNHGIIEFIEISCKIIGNGTEILEQNIVFAYFSRDEKVIHRKEWDSESVKERYNSDKGRVMLKFHFDKKSDNAGILEPKYHFHVGGQSEKEECYWHPKQIKLPRLPYPPLDIIILCDIILMNYFPDDRKKLSVDWFKLVKKSQKLFQKEYMDKVVASIDNDDDHEIYAHD